MSKKRKKEMSMPAVEELERELKRTKYHQSYHRTLRSTIYILVTVAAIAVLIATLVVPVLRIYGSSMSPTLYDGELVLAIKTRDFEKQDVIAFYYNNKVLVKRVIAGPGEWVNMDDEGNVTVDGKLLEEPYLKNKSMGNYDIELPYQVPEGRYFVMGDHRDISVDSRSEAVGCVAEEQIVGKLLFKVWPFESIGMI